MLVNVPLRNQLNEPSVDGSDENAHANCVPASISSAMSALTGTNYYGDELKDAVYGEAYTGGTAADNYVSYCAAHGVRLWREDLPTQAAMLSSILAHLDNHRPVVGTIPGHWTGDYAGVDVRHWNGVSHAICFCDYDSVAGTLTAMNPWPMDGVNAEYESGSYAWWLERLCYGCVYPMEAEVGVPFGWVESKDAKGEVVLTAPNKGTVSGAFAGYILKHQWPASLLPVSPEYEVEEGWGTEQRFSDEDMLSACLRWRRSDNAIWRAPGADVIQELRAEIAALDAKLKQPQGPQVPADLHNVLGVLSNLLAPFAESASGVASVMKELGY